MAQSGIEKPNAIEFNAAMKCFLVKWSGDIVLMVRFTPKPSCSCRPTRTCYHISAVQRSIGTWTSPTKRTINLTQSYVATNAQSNSAPVASDLGWEMSTSL